MQPSAQRRKPPAQLEPWVLLGEPPAREPVPQHIWLEALRDADLPGLQPLWEDLASCAVEPNPFYEPHMLLPALRAFSAGQEITFLCAFAPHPSLQKGRRVLCGLFPFAQRRAHGAPVAMLSLWKHPYCYLTAPLVRRGSEREVVSQVFDWLAAGGRATGLLRLEDFPGDGPLHQAFVEELKRRGWASQVSDWYTRAVLRPASSGEEYLAQALRGKRRKELRRQQSRLAEVGKVAFREVAPTEDPGPWVRDFLALEAAGWKGREQVAVLSQRDHARYIERISLDAFEKGRAMMLGLYLDGKPIALKHNLLAGEGGFAFKIAYDEAYARFSPGVLLELENVLRVHARPELQFMDSCASWNRFMINHLWTGRREMQTLFFATDDRRSSLLLALLPVSRWALRQARLARERLRWGSQPSPKHQAVVSRL